MVRSSRAGLNSYGTQDYELSPNPPEKRWAHPGRDGLSPWLPERYEISRFERLARLPNLETALACQVVFGIPAHELFPGVFAEVEKTVTKRARLLSDQLRAQRGHDRSGIGHKLAILKAIAAAAKPKQAA
jgi:hypothetical protein